MYESDFAHQYAFSMCIIQIGELVGQLSDELKSERQEVSWKLIKNMINLFAHDYASVDNEIVLDTLKNNIPDLKEQCEKILDEDLLE